MRVPDLHGLAEPEAGADDPRGRRQLASVTAGRSRSDRCPASNVPQPRQPIVGRPAMQRGRLGGRPTDGRCARPREPREGVGPQVSDCAEHGPRLRWRHPEPGAGQESQVSARGAGGSPAAECGPCGGGRMAAHHAVPIGLLALDSTGARVGEVAAATVGDLDENRKAWLVRAAVSKTRRARWVELPADLFDVVVDRLPAREDRDPGAAVPDRFGRPLADGDRPRLSRRWRAPVQPARSPPPPDQPAPPPGNELGRDRRARRATEPLDDRRHLHACVDGLPRDRPGEVARTCPCGAPLMCTPRSGQILHLQGRSRSAPPIPTRLAIERPHGCAVGHSCHGDPRDVAPP